MSTVTTADLSWVSSRALPTWFVRNDGHPRLARLDTYALSWAAAQAGDKWGAPWRGDHGFDKFWARTLRSPNYEAATPNRAFEVLAPLLDVHPPKVVCTIEGVTCELRRLVSPLGIAVELRCEIDSASGTPDDLQNAVNKIATDSTLRLDTDGSPSGLRKFLGDRLDELERDVRVDPDPSAVEASSPISVVGCTAVQDWPAGPPVEGDMLHKLLNGLAKGEPAGSSNLTPVTALVLTPRESGSSTTVRAMAGQGCVICPTSTSSPSSGWKIRCYVHNVATGLMRAQLMLNAVEWAGSQTLLTNDVNRLIKRAVIELDKGHGPANDSYRSRFIGNYIEGQRPGDHVRTLVGLPTKAPGD